MIKYYKIHTWRNKLITESKSVKSIKRRNKKNEFDYSLLVDTAILLGEIMLKNAIDIAANVQITLITLPILNTLFKETLKLVK